MSTDTKERSAERTAWICDNCSATTAPPRKRCAECGTSRY